VSTRALLLLLLASILVFATPLAKPDANAEEIKKTPFFMGVFLGTGGLGLGLNRGNPVLVQTALEIAKRHGLSGYDPLSDQWVGPAPQSSTPDFMIVGRSQTERIKLMEHYLRWKYFHDPMSYPAKQDLILIGFSRGAIAALELAEYVSPSTTRLLITMDPVVWAPWPKLGAEKIAGHCVNYYQLLRAGTIFDYLTYPIGTPIGECENHLINTAWVHHDMLPEYVQKDVIELVDKSIHQEPLPSIH
jgi:hypothetical protein